MMIKFDEGIIAKKTRANKKKHSEESNPGSRRFTYLDAEAERERHCDHDEENGQGR